jgi:hypothetical protein
MPLSQQRKENLLAIKDRFLVAHRDRHEEGFGDMQLACWAAERGFVRPRTRRGLRRLAKEFMEAIRSETFITPKGHEMSANIVWTGPVPVEVE